MQLASPPGWGKEPMQGVLLGDDWLPDAFGGGGSGGGAGLSEAEFNKLFGGEGDDWTDGFGEQPQLPPGAQPPPPPDGADGAAAAAARRARQARLARMREKGLGGAAVRQGAAPAAPAAAPAAPAAPAASPAPAPAAAADAAALSALSARVAALKKEARSAALRNSFLVSQNSSLTLKLEAAESRARELERENARLRALWEGQQVYLDQGAGI